MMVDAQLWDSYCQPYFKFSEPFSYDGIAIITAENPASIRQRSGVNRIENQRLMSDLKPYDFVRVQVGNRTFSWVENSYAAKIDRSEAIALAKKYRQNAIYYAVNKHLFLLSCLDDGIVKDLGEWYYRRV